MRKTNTKIVIRLMGGMGNQFFQYAFAKGMQAYIDENNLNYDVFLDESSYVRDKNRMNRLKDLTTSLSYITFFEALICEFCYKLFVKGICKFAFVRQETVSYKCEDMKHIVKLGKYQYLAGFWQNENYFRDSIALLRQELKYKNWNECLHSDSELSDLAINIQTSNSVAVHIRRGDYLSKEYCDIYQTQSLNYYEKAIEVMLMNVNKPMFFVFSDDIEWCKNELTKISGYDSRLFTFVTKKDEANDYIDLELMKLCKNFIIGNSSFSWWAAILSENNNIRIAPKKWLYNEKKNNDLNDALLSSFMVL